MREESPIPATRDASFRRETTDSMVFFSWGTTVSSTYSGVLKVSETRAVFRRVTADVKSSFENNTCGSAVK
ncbi:MAG: hypothetical protein MJ006_05405, partial [Methanocorpusculum sp.]|nr:hypothetical protein [Methanocorpusculum sp.]